MQIIIRISATVILETSIISKSHLLNISVDEQKKDIEVSSVV